MNYDFRVGLEETELITRIYNVICDSVERVLAQHVYGPADVINYIRSSTVAMLSGPDEIRGNYSKYQKAFEEYVENVEVNSWDNINRLASDIAMDCDGTFRHCRWKHKSIDCCKFVKMVSDGRRHKCLMMTLPVEKDGGAAYQNEPGKGLSQSYTSG